MARPGEAESLSCRILEPCNRGSSQRELGPLTIRPLRDGDTDTVAALFDRLGNESRVRRFNGAKPRLSPAELEQLARVDSGRHALVAYVDGDPQPAGLAQLVRDADRRRARRSPLPSPTATRGTALAALVELLAGDARAAGMTHLTATIQGSNAVAYALVRECRGG